MERIEIVKSQTFQISGLNLLSVTKSLGPDLNHRCFRQLTDTFRERGLFTEASFKNKFDTILAEKN